jgi:hypothetical protein
MDDKEVTEMDLGAGLLFREDEGAVGQKVSQSSNSSVVFSCCKVERREAYLITQISPPGAPVIFR